MLPKQAANPQKSGSTAHDVKGGAPGSKRTSGDGPGYGPSLFARLWMGKVAQQTRLHARPDRTAQHRRGAYAGREAEWARQEAKY